MSSNYYNSKSHSPISDGKFSTGWDYFFCSFICTVLAINCWVPTTWKFLEMQKSDLWGINKAQWEHNREKILDAYCIKGKSWGFLSILPNFIFLTTFSSCGLLDIFYWWETEAEKSNSSWVTEKVGYWARIWTHKYLSPKLCLAIGPYFLCRPLWFTIVVNNCCYQRQHFYITTGGLVHINVNEDPQYLTPTEFMKVVITCLFV